MKLEDINKLKKLQDDTLDSYNSKKISSQEMKNILRWANGMMLKYKNNTEASLEIN